MNNVINAISLRRKFKVAVTESYIAPIRKGMIGALVANVAKAGFALSPELISKLESTNEALVTSFYKFLVPELKKMVGDNVTYRHAYPNFPSQIATASDEELWFNAYMHYFGTAIGVRILPVYEKEERFPLCDIAKLKVIGLASEEEVENIFREILESKSSPSVQDREDIKTFISVNSTPNWKNLPVISNKEMLAYSISEFKKAKSPLYFQFLTQLKTSTDVLRVAVAFSEGDICLAEKTKFRNFTRSERRTLLFNIDRINVDQASEDMMRYRAAWIRLGEKLHPREYAKQFPNAAEAFRRIRNEGAETFNSRVDKGVRNGDWEAVVNTLATRPGEFARKLYFLLKNSKNREVIFNKYEEIAPQISNTVLWQVYAYFKGHSYLTYYSDRVFIPKGNISKIISSKNDLQPMPVSANVIGAITWNALVAKYAELPALGKVYVDPSVDKLLIPQGNRSASTALRTVGRGSRFALDKDAKIVRLFMYWKDIKNPKEYSYDGGRVDLDLSAIAFSDDFTCLGQCSYTNLRSVSDGYGYNRNRNPESYDMLHSIDETSAPDGASEFLDVNLDKLAKGVAYIAVTVTSYTGQKLSELDEGFAGWMVRKSMGDEGEFYEPTTVEGRVDLRSESTVTAPIILDVRNKEIIWCDVALKASGSYYNVHSTLDKSAQAVDAISRMIHTKPTLGDLFEAHIQARGELAETPEEADFVINEEGNLSQFDTAKIMSEFI